MKLTEAQLRKLIREEILAEAYKKSLKRDQDAYNKEVQGAVGSAANKLLAAAKRFEGKSVLMNIGGVRSVDVVSVEIDYQATWKNPLNPTFTVVYTHDGKRNKKMTTTDIGQLFLGN